MNENEPIAKKKLMNHSPPRGGAPRKNIRCSFELRLRAVKLHLEEGFTVELVAQELGVSYAAVSKWLQRYRHEGELGLRDHDRPPGQSKIPKPVREKIIELKKEEPSRGIKRISQLLKRVFFLQASPETVRQTLKKEDLVQSPPKPRRNLVRPRFFERATPNQMWQTDIFTFRLGGRYAYLIGFMDDYSRFLVGADLFRSQTAENVLEVFRVAMGEYNPPKEMLTDNGRQYTSWRGTSRFEAELKKSGIAHFKSRPHHPMTLGKIERFWETIWQEFLSRAQFDSFEAARERIRFWIKYYNHKRPHQGIEGLCPADRFFEIASQLRKTIESGIQENLLEMALRGQPKAPFYMVGRMEGQSVVLQAEKGKLKLSINNGNENQELTYDLKQDQTSAPANSVLPGQREGTGGSGGVDRPLQSGGSLPSAQDQLHDLSALAAAGHGGDAASAGVPRQPGPGTGVEPAIASPAGQPPETSQHREDCQPARTNPACQERGASGKNGVDESLATTCQPDLAGQGRADHGPTSGPTTGHLAASLLQMGEARPPRPSPIIGGSPHGQTSHGNGPGEGATPQPGERTGAPGSTV